MTSIIVTAGQTSSGLILNYGDTLTVSNGGTAINITVSSGGSAVTSSGGTESGTVLSLGGTVSVLTGGIEHNDRLLYSGAETVFSGGVASGDIVSGGGLLVISGGGIERGTQLSGGTDVILYAGSGSGTVISSAGSELVSSGGTATSTSISSGGSQTVFSRGFSSGTIISSGGTEVVSAQGNAVNTTVLSGTIRLTPFATASGTVVSSGGVEVVSAARVSATVISSGGQEFLYSGTTTTATVVDNGGLVTINNGVTASAMTVNSGGTVDVYYGVESGTVVNAGGAENLINTGSASGTILNSGAQEVLGLLSGNNNAYYVDGSETYGTIVSGGAEQVVENDNTALQTIISSGGLEVLFSGGYTSGTVVNSGGVLVSLPGSTASATVSAGGIVITSGVVVLAGSALVAYGAGTLTPTPVSMLEYVLKGGTANSSLVAGTGTQYIYGSGVANATSMNSGATEVVYNGGLANGTILSSGSTQYLYSGGLASGTDLLSGGAIDVSYLSATGGGSTSFNYTTDILTVQEGSRSYNEQLTGNYTGLYFTALRDSNNYGTLIQDQGTPCYCRGTLIATDRGEVPVEALQIGDNLITHTGATSPIIWIGRRSYAGRFAASNRDVLPVLIRAGALADNMPRRDLFVSPLHAMYLDGVLIPAAALVNGETIVQVELVDRIDYFHLELESHDVILAEGAPAETFLDDDSRGMFHNASEFAALYPDAPGTPGQYCALRVEGGDKLDAVRRRLIKRARPDLVIQTPGVPTKLLGGIDEIGGDRIRGWAFDEAKPDHPVCLRIVDNSIAVGEVVADRFRMDLAARGIGDGRHGFELIVPGGFSPLCVHLIEVRHATDGRALPTSPWMIEATLEAPENSLPLTLPALPALGAESAFRGRVDDATRERVSGWAYDGADPQAPVALQILDNGVLIARVLANVFRPDLKSAGIGRGWHGFDVSIPAGLSPFERHVIQVRRESNGMDLPRSPMVIEPIDSFDASLENTLAKAVTALATDRDLDHALSFLMAQTNRLLQKRADIAARRAERAAFRQARRRPQVAPRAAIADPGRRALVIDLQVPDTRRDAGSQAVLSHMRALRRLGYEVCFVAADEIEQPAPQLAADGIGYCGGPFYASVEDVLRRQADCFDVVYLHRAGIATRYLPLARQHQPRARILYSVADLHHVRLARQAAIEDHPELLAASHRMRMAECMAAWSANAVLTHSPVEAALLRQAVPGANVHEVAWDIPARATTIAFARRHGVAFVGNYNHAPNVDAACWLVEEVMPLVWQDNPGITCRVIGRDMPQRVRRLAGPRVRMVGHVTSLRRDVFNRVRLTVAPLRFGAGVKGKVLDSFAAGIPCVMSEVAAEGLPLTPDLCGLVGRDAAAMAALICRLHEDEASNGALSEAGLSLIEADFHADSVTRGLQAAIKGTPQKMMQREPKIAMNGR